MSIKLSKKKIKLKKRYTKKKNKDFRKKSNTRKGTINKIKVLRKTRRHKKKGGGSDGMETYTTGLYTCREGGILSISDNKHDFKSQVESFFLSRPNFIYPCEFKGKNWNESLGINAMSEEKIFEKYFGLTRKKGENKNDKYTGYRINEFNNKLEIKVKNDNNFANWNYNSDSNLLAKYNLERLLEHEKDKNQLNLIMDEKAKVFNDIILQKPMANNINDININDYIVKKKGDGDEEIENWFNTLEKKAWIYDAATSWISFMKHISNKEEDMSNQIYHYEGLATQIDPAFKPNIYDLSKYSGIVYDTNNYIYIKARINEKSNDKLKNPSQILSFSEVLFLNRIVCGLFEFLKITLIRFGSLRPVI